MLLYYVVSVSYLLYYHLIFFSTFFAEGYAPVAELLPLLSYCEATENDVREMVDNSPKNHFTLKEGPPLQIKANWGHKLKEVCTISIKSYGMLSIDYYNIIYILIYKFSKLNFMCRLDIMMQSTFIFN